MDNGHEAIAIIGAIILIWQLLSAILYKNPLLIICRGAVYYRNIFWKTYSKINLINVDSINLNVSYGRSLTKSILIKYKHIGSSEIIITSCECDVEDIIGILLDNVETTKEV